MNGLTNYAIKNDRVTYTLLALVFLAGLNAYRTMPRSQDPGFIVRTAMVQTVFPGASPERVEELVTDRLEKAIQEMPEVDYLTSTSKTNVSIIYVNIKERYKQMRPIWDSLRRKVEQEARNLPDGVREPLINDEFGDVFGTIISITGDGYSYAELKEVADQVKDELLLLENVGKVDLIGAQEEAIYLEYNNARLAELNLSPILLRQFLSSQNILTAGGSILVDKERIYLEPTGNYETVEDIGKTILSIPGSSEVVYLKDIVNIYRGYVDPPTSRMYASGEPALGLAVSLRTGGNIIDLGDEVGATIDRMLAVYPWGIAFDLVAFEPQEVQKVISSFTGNLFQSIAVVLLSMMLFLGLRTGLVVATLIPTTIMAAYLLMSFFSIGLDQISLAALIISLGLLVDNAIVMSESCMVQMSEGKSPVEAALSSAAELRIPLLTSSLTTAAAFLPIFLAKSTTGEYTASLFKVVSIALISSWLIALTLIPMLCTRFLKVDASVDDNYNNRFYRTYRGLLIYSLKRPVISLGLAVLIFFASLQLFKFIPSSFFPESDQAMFTVKFELPLGTAIEETSRAFRQLEAWIQEELSTNDSRPDGIINWSSYVGEGAPRFVLSYGPQPPSPEFAYAVFNASDYKLFPEILPKIRAYCETHFPDAKVQVQGLSKGPIIDSPVEVRLSGRDTGRLFELVDQVKDKLRGMEGTYNVDDDWGLKTKKLVVDVNQARVRRAGMTSQDIAISLQTNFSGIETTQYREEDKTIPITLRSVAADRQDIGKLETLTVYAQSTGRSVPLSQIADINVVWEPAKILRYDRLRTVTVSSKLSANVTASEITDVLLPWLDEESRNWPPGYRFALGGEFEESGAGQASIIEQLPIAGMIIVLLLVGQFNSLRRPLIILCTLPLGIIGVAVGLFVTGASMGFMAFLGVISLSGIVINNAIVLIDRIRIEIDENGHPPARAIIEAAQRRMRPILLTTITTLVGLLPLWFGGGPLFEPMAIAVIFGLAFATILTLGLVPLLYALFFGVNFKTYRYD